MSEKAHILVVEDDAKIGKALTLRLNANGYRVSIATDATTGLATALREVPDCILLDISMPAGGGFFVAEKMKINPRVSSIPFIFITASKAPGVEKHARELGAFEFLEKPFRSDELLAVIERALSTELAESEVEWLQ